MNELGRCSIAMPECQLMGKGLGGLGSSVTCCARSHRENKTKPSSTLKATIVKSCPFVPAILERFAKRSMHL